jgi:Uma2 family endonuclease
MIVTSLMTADELFRLPNDGARYELVRGELRKKMSPTGFEHGDVAMEIASSLNAHVKKNRLGKVVVTDVGFRIERNPDTVLGPDIAFVRSERIVKTRKFFEGPPDLAIEVVSPGDSYTEVEEKAADWLRGGTRAVIVVDPARQSVRIHRAAETVNVTDTISVEDVVPGWQLPLSEIFE